MTRHLRPFLMIALLALGGSASASSPAGVWSIPQLVQVLEEASDQPRVVLEGLFALYDGVTAAPAEFPGMTGYATPQWGVMHYQCKAGQKELCLQQWQELAAALETEQPCRGWGNQIDPRGTIRPYGSAPASPDEYVIDGGVVTGHTTCEYLATIEEPSGEPSPEPVAEVATEESPVTEPEPTAEPAVESSVSTDTRPTAMPLADEPAEDCSGGGASGLLAMLMALGALVRRRG